MEIILTDRALIKLEESLDFLKYQLKYNDYQLDTLSNRLFLKIESLKNNPFIGQRELLLLDQKEEFRRIIESDFKIIYFIKDNKIFITDFFHSRKNPKKMRS